MNENDASELLKIAEGREAEIFAYGEGRVLRLMRGNRSREALEREAAAMSAVAAAGAPAPRTYEIVERDGRLGIIMDRVDGIDLLTQVARQPWTVGSAGSISGRVHAALHAARAPASLLALREGLRAEIETSPRLAGDVQVRALAELAALPDGDAVCHGDYHPGNVIMSQNGPIVIDWPNAVRGDPAADVARTLMLLRIGEPPPGSPLPLRLLAKFGRGILVWAYVRAYRRVRPFDDRAIQGWRYVLAAHRLTEGIEEETPRLRKVLIEESG